MPMPRPVLRRSLLLATAFTFALGLAGCETSDVVDSFSEKIHDFNPFGTAKKKLAGERHPVFPEGVPGVQQGIPPELMPGGAESDTASIPEPEPEKKVVEKKKPSPRRTAVRESPSARPAARKETDRASAQPLQQTATPAPAGRSVWDAVPVAPNATAAAPKATPAARQGTAPPSQSGWAPVASQPVPTIWPDPPSAATTQ